MFVCVCVRERQRQRELHAMKQRNTPYNTLIIATPGNQKQKKKKTEALCISPHAQSNIMEPTTKICSNISICQKYLAHLNQML